MITNTVFCDKCKKDISNEAIHILSTGILGEPNPRFTVHLCDEHFKIVAEALEASFTEEATDGTN